MPQEHTFECTYDLLGRLLAVTDAQGNQTLYDYDSLGRQLFLDDPDLGLRSYRYDDAGRVVRATDAMDQTLSFTYDTVGRMTSKRYGSGLIAATYSYDEAGHGVGLGQMTSMRDLSGWTAAHRTMRGS